MFIIFSYFAHVIKLITCEFFLLEYFGFIRIISDHLERGIVAIIVAHTFSFLSPLKLISFNDFLQAKL